MKVENISCQSWLRYEYNKLCDTNGSRLVESHPRSTLFTLVRSPGVVASAAGSCVHICRPVRGSKGCGVVAVCLRVIVEVIFDASGSYGTSQGVSKRGGLV